MKEQESLRQLALSRYRSEVSFVQFMQQGWGEIEAGNPMVHNWTMEAMSDHLMATVNGDVKRLLINVPPGFSKSMMVNVFFPAWVWGPKNKPVQRFISFSHNVALSMRDLLRCRYVINSQWYQDRWKTRYGFASDQNQKGNYQNDRTGWRMACAMNNMTGNRADFIIGDDPHTVMGAESEASRISVLQNFSESISTRLNNPKESVIIIIMQRIHERDLSGYIIASEIGYDHLMLPMEYEPDRACYSRIKPTWRKSKPVDCAYNKQKAQWEPAKKKTKMFKKCTSRIFANTRASCLINIVMTVKRLITLKSHCLRGAVTTRLLVSFSSVPM